MDSNIMILIVCIVILIIVVLGIYIYHKVTTPTESDENKAKEFINGFTDIFKEIIQEAINETDLSQYTSIMEFEADIFAKIYNRCWDYVEGALADATANSKIGSLVAKCVTKDNVEAVVKVIFDTFFVKQLDAIEEARITETSEEAIAEDARLQHEADLYETETKVVPEYEEVEEEEIDTTKLKPQRDEEEPYDPDDAGMELIDDDDQVEGQIDMDFSENYAGEDIDDDDDD